MNPNFTKCFKVLYMCYNFGSWTSNYIFDLFLFMIIAFLKYIFLPVAADILNEIFHSRVYGKKHDVQEDDSAIMLYFQSSL